MIRPSLTLSMILGLAGAISLGLMLVNPAWGMGSVWLLILIILFALTDALLSKKPGALEFSINSEKRIMVGRPSFLDIFIDFKGTGARPKTRAAVLLEGVFRPLEKTIFGVGPTGVRVPLVAFRRGLGKVPHIRVRWSGPFQLTYWQKDYPCNLEISIIPDTKLVENEALNFNERDAMFGIKPQRQQGEGTEFEALREFVTGLDPRSIDWKHSARHQNLLCKQFEVERNHQVILAFDAGHLMSGEIDGLSKIDHAINASLVLAYRTLRAGDKVGYFTFDSTVRDYFSPISGPQTLSLIRDRLAGLEYSHDETNFTLGLSTLMDRLNRRSLIILFTDFVDTITAEIMMENIARLSRHHLVLFVSFKDKLLIDLFANQPESFGDVSRAVVAKQFLDERAALYKRLNKIGIHCLESPSADLAGDLVSQYLYIKNRELI